MSVLTKFAIASTDINIPAISGDQVFHNALNITYFVAGVIAVLVIILAGFSLVTSGNNPANVTKAKNSILYAVIGLVVILSAFAITQYVIGGLK